MNLNANQMGYFIQQVGLAAASFGVSAADVATVGAALDKLFNKKCSPPTDVLGTGGKSTFLIQQWSPVVDARYPDDLIRVYRDFNSQH